MNHKSEALAARLGAGALAKIRAALGATLASRF